MTTLRIPTQCLAHAVADSLCFGFLMLLTLPVYQEPKMRCVHPLGNSQGSSLLGRSWSHLVSILAHYELHGASKSFQDAFRGLEEFSNPPWVPIFSPYKILHIRKVFITFEITLNNTALYLRSNTYHNHSVSSFSRASITLPIRPDSLKGQISQVFLGAQAFMRKTL